MKARGTGFPNKNLNRFQILKTHTGFGIELLLYTFYQPLAKKDFRLLGPR